VQVQGDNVLLRLQLEGGQEQLARQLVLDNRLGVAVDAGATPAADAMPANGTTPQPELHYRWLAGRG
jgi:hypothetical protein